MTAPKSVRDFSFELGVVEVDGWERLSWKQLRSLYSVWSEDKWTRSKCSHWERSAVFLLQIPPRERRISWSAAPVARLLGGNTHTHICIRIHICVHIPIWMYQHTYTHRHTQLDMGTGPSDCSASLEVAEVRGECYALLLLLTRKRGTFHCTELQHKMVYAFMMSFFSVSQHIWKTLVLKSCYSLVSTHAWHGSSAYSSRPFDVGKKHRWR